MIDYRICSCGKYIYFGEMKDGDENICSDCGTTYILAELWFPDEGIVSELLTKEEYDNI